MKSFILFTSGEHFISLELALFQNKYKTKTSKRNSNKKQLYTINPEMDGFHQ